MGANAEMFLSLRDEEVNGQVYFKGKTRKEVIQSAEQFADELLDSGEFNSQEALTRLVKLSDYLTAFEKKLRADIESEMVGNDKLTISGVTMAFSEGSQRMNYKDDPIYAEMQEALKQREELLKVANKSKTPIYDSEGIEIPKITVSFTKSFIKVSY